MEVFILLFSVVAAAAAVCLCITKQLFTVLIIVFGNGFFVRCVFSASAILGVSLCVTAVNDAATATSAATAATAILKNNTTNKCMSLRKSNQKARDKGLSITM